jgi:hypothetical protein
MGKTTTFNKYFKPKGYIYVDRKSFETESKCMKATEDSIKAGKSVVVGTFHRLILDTISLLTVLTRWHQLRRQYA